MGTPRPPSTPAGFFLAFLSVALLAQPCMLLADAFDTYRIPAHRVTSWDVALGSNGSRVVNASYSEQENRALGGSLRSSYFWLSDADPRRTLASLDLTGQGSRTRQHSFGRDPGYSTYDRLAHLRYVSEGVNGRLQHERYASTMPFAVGVDLQGFAQWDQRWDDSRDERDYEQPYYYDRSIEWSRSQRWALTHGIEGTLELGLGRTRDATPVYEVMVLERRLRESGVLEGALGLRTREQLAGLLAVADDYARTRDRPGKDAWEELSRILAADPATRDSGVDPRSLQRALERFVGPGGGGTFARSPVMRATGTGIRLVGTGRQGDTTDRRDTDYTREVWRADTLVYSDTYHSPSHYRTNATDAFAGLAAEYHRPLGESWQIDATSSALLSLRTANNSIEFEFTGEAQRIIADRWLGSVTVRHQWIDADRTRGPTGMDTAYWAIGTSLDYYLEDRLVLRVSGVSQQTWSRGAPGEAVHRFWRNDRFDLTLTYRIAGRFSAPGYFGAARTGGQQR